MYAIRSYYVTVNGYLGIDGIKPFIETGKKFGKGIFILVKTSNPSSGQLQDLILEDGRTVYEAMAELVDEWGASDIGTSGYSSRNNFVQHTLYEVIRERIVDIKNELVTLKKEVASKLKMFDEQLTGVIGDFGDENIALQEVAATQDISEETVQNSGVQEETDLPQA